MAKSIVSFIACAWIGCASAGPVAAEREMCAQAPDLDVPEPDAGIAHASFNSIPQAHVVLDGRPLGRTPVMDVAIPAGNHTVVFVDAELGRRSRTFNLRSGETKTIVTNFRR